ncbi:MAG: hypothetical protein DDT28_00267 [Dehalococcoidia bacterium]|nr:hypothetical protein [Chloroflexota bacterium]
MYLVEQHELSLEGIGYLAGKADSVTIDGEVDIVACPAEETISDVSTDEIAFDALRGKKFLQAG